MAQEELNAALDEIMRLPEHRDWFAQHQQQPSQLFLDWCGLILEVNLEQASVSPNHVVQGGE